MTSQNVKKEEKEWNSVWGRGGLMKKTIDIGREVYNLFFKRLLKKHINKSTDLLEVGCGTSTLTISLCSKINSLTGVDISEKALEHSRRHAKKLKKENCKFVKGDCFNLPFEENTYDVVWSQGLIEHFSNPEEIIKEKLRVCKSGGVVLTSVPYKYSYMLPWYWITRPKIFRRFWPWTDQEFYDQKKFQEIADQLKNQYSSHRIFVLQPFFLGIIILELHKK